MDRSYGLTVKGLMTGVANGWQILPRGAFVLDLNTLESELGKQEGECELTRHLGIMKRRVSL